VLPEQHRRGILNVTKPSGPSSYDVIRLLKARLKPGPGRIGHAGTLDPLASGVLLVLFEEATRISRLLLDLPKEYQARILFGRATDTDDITGRTTGELPVPNLTAVELQVALDRFVGTISQTPPKFCALKHAGRPLYRLARAGEALEPAARQVTAYELQVVAWNPPEATVRAVVSAGFYVRALARDLGAAVGTCATLSGLIRTRIGHFSHETAIPPDAVNPGNINNLLTPIPQALPDYPRIIVSPAESAALLQGRALRPAALSCSEIATTTNAALAFASTADSRFLALVAIADSSICPRRIIHAD